MNDIKLIVLGKEMTLSDAEALYRDLDKIFGNKPKVTKDWWNKQQRGGVLPTPTQIYYKTNVMGKDICIQKEPDPNITYTQTRVEGEDFTNRVLVLTKEAEDAIRQYWEDKYNNIPDGNTPV